SSARSRGRAPRSSAGTSGAARCSISSWCSVTVLSIRGNARPSGPRAAGRRVRHANPNRRRLPVPRRCAWARTRGPGGIGPAARGELRAELRGTRAPLGPRRDEAGYKTLTAEKPLLFQPIERLGDDLRPETARGQLALELEAAVLAAGEKRNRAPLALGFLVR